MRKSLTYILESDDSIKVVGIAEDGIEAIKKVRELHPDAVLLDIEMPGMDGFTALRHIMSECPIPVLVISGLDKKDTSIAIKSLEHGAIDFIAKPSGVISYNIDQIRGEIIAKVKMAAGVDVRKLELKRPGETFQKQWSQRTRKGIVVIGASTGGRGGVVRVFAGLRGGSPTAILVVQHITREFIPYLADRFRWGCSLEVAVAEEGEIVASGRVLVAPGLHTKIVQDGDQKRISLVRESSHEFSSCAVNCAMESAAGAYGKGALGVLLTGMGNDGAQGMKAIKDAGGGTIAEDPSTCVVFGMPRAAIETGCVDRVVPLPGIAQAIIEMI